MKKYNSKWFKILTKKFLIKKYIKNKKSAKQIADEIGCTNTTIFNYLIKYNISIRNRNESQQLRYKIFKVLTKKFLYQEYIKNKKSTYQIAKAKGIDLKRNKDLLGFKCIYAFADRPNSNLDYLPEKALLKALPSIIGKPVNISHDRRYVVGHILDYRYQQTRCSKCATILLWKDEKYREKTLRAMFKGMKLFPNKCEKKLNELLNKILSNKYKFVGDGKLIVEGFCPDFVNKANNKIIEMFGDYWHNREDWSK